MTNSVCITWVHVKTAYGVEHFPCSSLESAFTFIRDLQDEDPEARVIAIEDVCVVGWLAYAHANDVDGVGATATA